MDSQLKERLLQAKQTLQKQYDDLNRAWKEAEELLVSINVGRAVAVHVYDEDGSDVVMMPPDDPPEDRPHYNLANHRDSLDHSHYLAFKKVDRQWRICYGSVPTGWDWDSPDINLYKPILDCRTEDRVHVAHFLPDLLAAVAAQAEKVAMEVQEAANTLKATIAPFKPER